MHYFLFKFTLVLNSILLFWKLLLFEFLLRISETSLWSTSARNVKMLDVNQLLILFSGMLTYSEQRPFYLTVFIML
jgi:hypothetical protein